MFRALREGKLAIKADGCAATLHSTFIFGVLCFLVVLADAGVAFEVPACVQTEPASESGDVLDDAAIWVSQKSPSESLIIGTNKKTGLNVYDLEGRRLQFLPLGETNGVDLRADFPFGSGREAIIATNDRSTGTLLFFRFDGRRSRIDPRPVGQTSHSVRTYGVCLYRTADRRFYVGVTSKGGAFDQWRLDVRSNGKIIAHHVRTLSLSSTAEGCVFDDELERLYIAEEGNGIWRFPANPAEGNDGVLIDKIDLEQGFPPDVEGLAIHAPEADPGYLIASNQGNSTFRLYRRDGDNEYVGSFRVTGCESGAAHDVSHSDGVASVGVALGPDWPEGLLVVQDDQNGGSEGRQSFRYVSWKDIRLKLPYKPMP